MVMPAATASVVLVVVASASASAFMVSAASAMIAATAFVASASSFVPTTAAAAASAEHVQVSGDFFIGGRTGFKDFSFEVKRLAGPRVVEVDAHILFAHFHHGAQHLQAVTVVERKHGTGIDVGFVKTSVDAENIFGELQNMLFHVRAVAIINGECEVELFAGGQSGDVFLKRIKCLSHAGDDLQGMLGSDFLQQFVNAFFVVGVCFVGEDNSLVIHVDFC